MKISTKGRYAVRLMLDLASYNTGNPVALKDIAKRQEVSEKYLEQIISILNRAGFVKSVRGAQGGYILTKKPGEYSVGSILRLTEGELVPVDCVLEGRGSCNRGNSCVTYGVWEKLYQAISEVVDSITLETLMEWQNELVDNYSI